MKHTVEVFIRIQSTFSVEFKTFPTHFYRRRKEGRKEIREERRKEGKRKKMKRKEKRKEKERYFIEQIEQQADSISVMCRQPLLSKNFMCFLIIFLSLWQVLHRPGLLLRNPRAKG